MGGVRPVDRRGAVGAPPRSRRVDPASFPAGSDWWANVRTRDRGLLALFLFADIAESDAPTRVLVGSHHDVARVLEPAGDRGLTIAGVMARLGPRVFERDVGLVTGAAGDVYLRW